MTGLDRRRRRGRDCVGLQTIIVEQLLINAEKPKKSRRAYLVNLKKFKKPDEKSQPKRATNLKRGKICRVTGVTEISAGKQYCVSLLVNKITCFL